MRLFIAINFNETVKSNLIDTIDCLKDRGVSGNFTLVENLHLTLVFIGETNRLSDVKSILDNASFNPFDITLENLGSFKCNDGDIFWMGIQAPKDLFHLQRQLRNSLIEANFAIENRTYRPHLTLARRASFPKDFDLKTLARELPKQKATIDKISLMKSERLNGRLVYTELYSVSDSESSLPPVN